MSPSIMRVPFDSLIRVPFDSLPFDSLGTRTAMHRPRRRALPIHPLAALLILASLIDMVSYNWLINRTRHVTSLNGRFVAGEPGARVSPMLAFMLWSIPAACQDCDGVGPEQYAALV